VLAALAVALLLLHVHELAILFGAGALTWLLSSRRAPSDAARQKLAPALPLLGMAHASSLLTFPSLFWVFFKIGSLLFGSGYVLLAFLRSELVERLHWLSEAQLIDAVAVGQITPGPVFTTATFVGYLLAGPGGALVATAGIFLPAFLFVALSAPLVPRLRASPRAAAFLDGVNVASLALMAVATLQLAHAAIVDLPTLVIAALAAFALLRLQLGATWLIVGGAALGIVLMLSDT
jgi:chromate transporter